MEHMTIMRKTLLTCVALVALVSLGLISVGPSSQTAAFALPRAQNPPTPSGQEDFTYKVRVDLVLLSVAVTDHSGHYVKSLKPSDFRIYEDGVPQKLALFSEGGG